MLEAVKDEQRDVAQAVNEQGISLPCSLLHSHLFSLFCFNILMLLFFFKKKKIYFFFYSRSGDRQWRGMERLGRGKQVAMVISGLAL